MRSAARTALLALACAAMAGPFLWMAATSLMGQLEVFSPGRILPASPLWSNYPEALTAQPFARYFLNSLVFAVAVVAGQVATATAAGYAFARLRFPGRDRIFMLFLATMMVPVVVVLIPRFLMIDALGWIDSYQGLISTELVSVWGIFLMRQYFRTVPRDLEDAARVDGAGHWRIFWSVALPLAKPAVATLGLFAFVDAWKNLLWPLLVTRSMEMRVVEVGIAAFHSTYEINWPYQMAAGVVAVLPIALLFLFTQRYFVRGIQLEGIR
ncbi:MAG: carbohydrate ABC transporter permease [Gemmatimonadota bacterium]|nr:carbohydrate ABC transporter permease [Gemmatimonadota bacterium]MDE2864027.1 carbohydrate ABC transporter permease [Gemmatimonadota bacterium]MXV96889.1 carbohydrate ABC transporter permease [Gemmatimonadota bacterium]MYB06278.1 carbohydrate ABC transporter permease [Gemmatimonadota bacterium]MYE14958.1 carbohydrate ABC transporter permease [Gemmatimonadota bacterium]